MRRVIQTALLIAAASASAVAQRGVNPAEVHGWMNDLRPAVERYRSGDTAGALAILRERSTSELRLLPKILLPFVEAPYVPPFPRDDRERPVLPWTARDVHALAALEMEGALRVYLDRVDATAPEHVWAYVEAAEPLFAYVSSKEQSASDSVPRWKLVVGSTALADGELWWAAALLERASREHPQEPPLLLAHASAREAIAMLPAHALLSEGRVGSNGAVTSFGAESQQTARATRARHLSAARLALESVLQRESGNSEAALRLGHLHILMGDHQTAASLLNGLVSGEKAVDVRTAYLGRLLLGRASGERGQHEEAIAFFRAAASAVPAAQSAYVGLIEALLARGTAKEAAATAERMMAATAPGTDPWWGYTYGQFWILDPALAQLRAEARQ